MREYIFKGTAKNGAAVYGFLSCHTPAYSVIVDLNGKFNEVEPESVKQWTGFRSANGTAIFEDDNVTYRGTPCQIRYNAFAGKCYICSNGALFHPLNANTAKECEL